MKRLLSLAIVLASVANPWSGRADPVPDRVVVVISVDGLAQFYFDDPKAEMPTLREMAAQGARSEGMKPVLPTVTWPNHTSMVTGVRPEKHGVLGNAFFDREKGKAISLLWDPILDKEQIVKVSTIYDVAKKAGMKTAAICWPGSRGAKTLDWTVPLVNSDELFYAYGTPSLWADFDAAGISYAREAEGFLPGRGEERDSVHVDMFNEILRKHRPQLALLHLLEVDHIEHVKGPQSPEAYRAIKFADDCVRRIRDALQTHFPGKATLLIVSDHGFLPYRQTVNLNVLLQNEGLLEVSKGAIGKAKIRAVGGGGCSFLYVLDPAKRKSLIEEARKLFQGAEGVASFLTEEDFARYGMADPKENPQMGDVVLTASKGYSFSDTVGGGDVYPPKAAGMRGTHGYDPNLAELQATFIAWGAGIQSGASLGRIANIDVAPTIAELLGLELPGVEGKPLKGAFKAER